MAIGTTLNYQRGSTNGTTWDTGTITAPSEGDLVYIYINYNDNVSITVAIDAAGSAWNTVLNEALADESAWHCLFWKVAGASEPTSYSGTGKNVEYRVITKVTSGGGIGWLIDSPVNVVRTSGTSTSMVCEAPNGETVANNSISFVTGTKDRREATPANIDTADNSYIGATGNVAHQYTVAAHRVFATGETIAFDVTCTPTGDADNTVSTHISFIEGSGGGGFNTAWAINANTIIG